MKLLIIFITLVLTNQVHCNNDSSQNCPVLFIRTDLGCQCGFAVEEKIEHFSAKHFMRCHFSANTTYASLNPAYCMSYNEITGVLVGYCPYNSCSKRGASQCIGRYVKIPRDPLFINDVMCGEINRTGVLCSKCEDGLGPAVFSYGLPCVECRGNIHGWMLYFTLAFLPSTIFFLLLTAFQIHVSSSTLINIVMMCQLFVNFVNGSPAKYEVGEEPYHSIQLLFLTVYGIWNLDFFRYVIPPFCISEHMTALQIVSLEYIVAIYPLLLIIVTYILIQLHDRGCRVLVLMWRPFHKCFTHFRRQWNPKATIIHAFASFILIAYIKVAVISCTLLKNSFLNDGRASRLTVYVDPSIKSFSSSHAPYAALGLLALIIFTFLPLLTLTLYPLKLTQQCLGALHVKIYFIKEVIQSLLGCYKDGTGQAGGKDFRLFAAIFLFLRIVYVGMLVIPNIIVKAIVITFTIVLATCVAYLKPYKEDWCNIWSTFVLLALGTATIAVVLTHTVPVFFIVLNVIACLPLLYMIVLVLAVTAKNIQLVKRLKHLYQKATGGNSGTASVDSEESLPYRLLEHTSMTDLQL